MKRTEEIFTSTGIIDKKCKLNRSMRRIDRSILDTIDQGVTLEYLDELAKKGIPIMRYKTQITIHGMFPTDIGEGRVFGYKSIVRNQNGSIGVRYIAVDECKRKEMKPYMSTIGFSYSKNSSEQKFTIQRRVDKENYQSTLNEMKEVAKKIDTSLFIGGVDMYAAKVFGTVYLCLDLTVSAIYQKNIRPLLDKLGATEDKKKALEDQRERDRLEFEQKMANRQAEAQQRRDTQMADNKHHIDRIVSEFGQPREFNKKEVGVFMNYGMYHNEFGIVVQHRMKLDNRAIMPHVLSEIFKNAEDAIEFARSEQKYSSLTWKKDSTSLYSTFKGARVK